MGSCNAHWTYLAVICCDHASLLVPFTSYANSSLLTASTNIGHARQKETAGRLQRPRCKAPASHLPHLWRPTKGQRSLTPNTERALPTVSPHDWIYTSRVDWFTSL